MTCNLHKYDYQVKYDYITSGEIDINQITKLFDRLKQGKEVFKILIDSIGHEANIDRVNDLYVDKLLNDISIISKDIEDLTVLEEQLIDMRTGLCQAGRSLRLVQVLKAWRSI